MDEEETEDGLSVVQVFMSKVVTYMLNINRDFMDQAMKKPSKNDAMKKFINGEDVDLSIAISILVPEEGHENQSLTLDRIMISSAAEMPLDANSVLCLDCEKIGPIKANNMRSRIFFRRLAPLNPLINVLYDHIDTFFVPAMKEQIGNLGKVEPAQKAKFITDVYDYLISLDASAACVTEKVKLTPCRDLDQEILRSEARCIEAAHNLKDLGAIEECACRWMRQISLEIQEVDMVREELSNSGPHTEVRFWKRRAARFNSLLNELGNIEVKHALLALKAAQSKTMTTWQELDDRVIAIYNEAVKNAKYLQIVCEQCRPLYENHVVEMERNVRYLLQCLRLIYNYSLHYRSFSNMSILFVKITNQMITSCKGYITDSGMSPLWQQNPNELLKRLNVCIRLNKTYQQAYAETQAIVKEGENSLNFSKIQIFGDFDEFTTRLDAIIHIISVLKKYGVLETVFFEGKEKILEHYRKIKKFITSRTYDLLATENTQFTKDFEFFGSEVNVLQENIMNAYNLQCTRGQSSLINLRMMMHMEDIKVPSIGRESRYRRLFGNFRTEIDDVGMRYSIQCNDPPLDRDMPSFAGRVAWARKNYLRLAEPMSIFWRQMPSVRDTKDGLKTIQKFNKVCEALVGYEILSFHAWKKTITEQMSSMNVSVIVMAQHNGKTQYLVNYDGQVRALMRELTCLNRFGCPLPPIAIKMNRRSNFIKTRAGKIRDMIQLMKTVFEEVPSEIEKLLVVRIHRLNETLAPGLYMHDWYSSLVDQWLKATEDDLNGLLNVLKQAGDIVNNRIEVFLEKLMNYKLAVLPEQPEEPTFYLGHSGGPIETLAQAQGKREPGVAWSLPELIQQTHMQAAHVSTEMQQLSSSAYDAAQDYVNLLVRDFDDFVTHFVSSGLPDQDNVTIGSIDTFERDQVKTGGTRRSTRLMTAHDPSRKMQEFSRVRKMIKKTFESIDDIMRMYGQKTLDAIIKSMRSTLEELWRYLGVKDAQIVLKDIAPGKSHKTTKLKPFSIVRCEMVLSGDKLNIKPSLDEIQAGIRMIVNIVLSAMKAIGKWTERGRKVPPTLAAIQGKYTKKPTESLAMNTAVGMEGNPLADINSGPRSSIAMDRSSIFTGRSSNLVSQTTESQSGKSGSFDDRPRTSFAGRTSVRTVSRPTNTPQGASSGGDVDINCYTDVRHDREVYRAQAMLLSWITSMRRILFLPEYEVMEIKLVTEPFERFAALWQMTPEKQLDEFLADSFEPTITEFETKFMELSEIEHDLLQLWDIYYVGPLEVHTSNFKHLALKRLREHQQVFVDMCTERYINVMFTEASQLDELDRNLTRSIGNLDDVALIMDAITNFHRVEVSLDLTISKAEEAQLLMSKRPPSIPSELADQIEQTRYLYNKVVEQVQSTMNEILEVESNYRDKLTVMVEGVLKSKEEFLTAFKTKGPATPGISQTEAFDRQRLFRSDYEQLFKRAESAQRGQLLFGLPVMDTTDLKQAGRQLDLLQRLYGLYSDVYSLVASFEDQMWKDADMESMEVSLVALQTRCRKLPSALKSWSAYSELEATLTSLVGKLPILQMLRNKAMKSRHWAAISDVTKQANMDPEHFDLTTKSIIDLPIGPNDGPREAVEEICIGAAREKEIEAKLQNISSDWSVQELALAQFKARGELLLKGDRTLEITTLLEDSLVTLSSLSNNRFNRPFKSQIHHWMSALSIVNEVMDNWMRVQSLWVYLEAVFVGGDIAKQLPQEARRFTQVDKAWVKLMERAHENPGVISCCTVDSSMQEMLPHMLDQLEMCQRSLSGYLEGKRLLFPRFFFVSDPVLLEILGQASTPEAIQQHLLTIFDSLDHVKFNESISKVECVYSAEDEELQLTPTVECLGPVEVWLGNLLFVSHDSLLERIRVCYIMLMDPELDLLKFLDEYPSQLGLLGIQLIWTHDATDALNEAKENPKIMQDTNKNFLTLLELLISQTTRNLSKTARTKYETLITIHLHQKDIFDALVKMGLKSANDFEWLKQTRFYFVEDLNVCMVSITNVDFKYQNEFLGCTERLVITPLTDRCYITLAQALNMSFGGAPAGPAGTGKTETTKDMGRCLGQYVVVFNCSDQMDFRGLGRIYKGLAQSGAWGCFDEFNRIELPVLSVAAQQIAIVLFAKRDGKDEFIFADGDVVALNPEFGIFITMNPGYAGRQELPENLKINFRTVSMMVPDRHIIIRVKMASCGFIENAPLAKKFFYLYGLCEQQLSKQVHYDFGLRNILSVLRTFGAVRRSNPEEPETRIVMRVLRDMNLSKLVDQDEPLFLSILKDLFPGVILSNDVRYPELISALERIAVEMDLIPHKPWMLKVLQLYETQNVRHGMMALGPSGSGKSKCVTLLLRALTETHEPRKEVRMNPKAITAPEMFGKLDAATNDWTDGIFSTLWRRTVKMKKGEHCWIILDGPVDAIWIENLNSVLDDNKLLTLANGDRIPMAPNAKILFEVDNVDNASPATISRNGMVYISSAALNWEPIFKTWVKKRPHSDADALMDLANSVFPKVVKFVMQELNIKMHFLEAFYITQFNTVFDAIVAPNESLSPNSLQVLFIFCLTWSFGALMDLDDRDRFDAFLRSSEFNLSMPPHSEKGIRKTLFDYRFEKNTAKWAYWGDYVAAYDYPTAGAVEFEKVLVPNQENVITEYLVNSVAKNHKSVLLFGEPGTAKTAIINKYLSIFNIETQIARIYNFSSVTTPASFQAAMEGFVDKRVGFTFGPPPGKRLTVFIDDISMPIVNEWGDQVANEIVRQTMECGGFYSLEKPGEFISIVDVQFAGAMGTPGGGRNDIPMRLKRQFCVFICNLPGSHSMDHIFRTIGIGHFSKERGFSDEIRAMVEVLVPLTRVVWASVKAKMLPTPMKFHYIFNLRDLSRIWQGMVFAECEVYTNSDILLLLWKNEVTRTLADKLTDAHDKAWFAMNLIRTVESEVNEQAAEVCKRKASFCDFMRDADPDGGADDEEEDDENDGVPRIYEPVYEIPTIKKRLDDFLVQMNEESRRCPLKYVFFTKAIGHIVRVCRATRYDRGSVLLVGVGGSGKQSITRLAAYVSCYKLFQINTSSVYTVANLLEDLKSLYRLAGTSGNGVIFLFGDKNIKDEIFLDYVNNILMGGQVNSYFAREELEEVGNNLTNVYRRKNPRKPSELPQLIDFFLTRARNNVHIALCFSPIGEKFRARALAFPGLIAGCTIDWFHAWPRDALTACADFLLETFAPCVGENALRLRCVECVADIHIHAQKTCEDYFRIVRRTNHVTPKTFFHFINGCKKVYDTKVIELREITDRMDTGVRKLVEAKISINELQIDLVVKEEELKVANAVAEEVLANVLVQTQAAEKVKNKVEIKKHRCEKIVSSITADRKVAESQLEAARPALEEAEEALNTIKPGDIATVRKLAKPPNLIMRIMDCVCILFYTNLDTVQADHEKEGIKTSWGESIRFMSQATFLANLLDFPKHILTKEMMDLLEHYMEAPDYNISSAKKSCGNVAGLLSWTTAMVKFFWVNTVIVPLQDNLAAAEQRLNRAMKELGIAEDMLAEKAAILARVQADYDNAMGKKQKLQDEADLCRRRMVTANQLIDGLGGEMTRWTEQSITYKQLIVKLTGDAITMAAFLTYAGGFNQNFRWSMSKATIKALQQNTVPSSPQLDIVKSLANPTTLNEWTVQGLPLDELSLQNAVIATSRLRYPLLVDPQGQGKKWLSNLYADNFLATAMTHKLFKNHVENALNNGLTLFVEGISEDFDPGLDSVLAQEFTRVGNSVQVNVWDFQTAVDSNFQMFVSTQLANPVYSPELLASAVLIDFNVTVKGLEDQLLARVITLEREKLEKSRVELLTNMVENKKKVEQLEINLLFRLKNTQGSLVDDLGLLQVLQTTKKTAEEVMQQLSQAAETEAEINHAREEYRPVAERGALIYFLIQDISTINPMYAMGLRQFLTLFDDSLLSSEKSAVTQKRITKILKFMLMRLWKFTTRSLYKKDSIMFTLALAIRIDLQQNHIRKEEVDVFLKGGSALSVQVCPAKPARWIPDNVWLNVNAISKLRSFASIVDQVSTSEKRWRRWYDTDAPEEEPLPFGYDADLSAFGRLIMIRAWCLDRVVRQAKKYIAEALGHRYAEENLLSLEETHADSVNFTPILNLLTVGADPTLLIEQFAKKQKVDFNFISMGQGQELHARKFVAEAMKHGGWVLLQNCHLCLDYIVELFNLMSDVQKEVELRHIREELNQKEDRDGGVLSRTESGGSVGGGGGMGPGNIQPKKPTAVVSNKFRLWITTEEHAKFPVSFLQISIKFTNQPPEGLRSGLAKTYSDVSQDFLDACVSIQWKVMLYAVAFLHRTVEERRKFSPIGWSVPYEFNQADFNASVEFVRGHIDEIEFSKKNLKTSGVEWKCVRYMLSEIQYGGRITDSEDIIIMITLVRRLFLEKMFQPDFQLAPGYVIPRLSTVNQYLGFINALPLQESPEYSTRFSETAIANIGLITTSDVTSGDADDGHQGPTKESQVKEMCESMLERLPAVYNKYEVAERIEAMGSLQPIVIFLRQEVQRISKLLEVTHLVLKNLIMAIDGKIIMNAHLREAMDAMYNAKVPLEWLRYSWNSITLGFWFTELMDRNTQLASWLFDVRPSSFWLSGFFNPLGILTAVRQEASRQHLGWSLEFVSLTTEVTKYSPDELHESAKEGIFIHGLFIQAGSWDRRTGRIVEAKPKQLFDIMPVINVVAQCDLSQEEINKQMGEKTKSIIKSGGGDQSNSAAVYELQTNVSADARKSALPTPSFGGAAPAAKLTLPVYKKAMRTGQHFITKFKIPCSKTPDHWIMRGVALLCDTH